MRRMALDEGLAEPTMFGIWVFDAGYPRDVAVGILPQSHHSFPQVNRIETTLGYPLIIAI